MSLRLFCHLLTNRDQYLVCDVIKIDLPPSNIFFDRGKTSNKAEKGDYLLFSLKNEEIIFKFLGPVFVH